VRFNNTANYAKVHPTSIIVQWPSTESHHGEADQFWQHPGYVVLSYLTHLAWSASDPMLAGLLGGIAVSFFSKPLAIIFGLFVAGVQYLEYKGIHIIPYRRLQSYFSSVDLRSAVQENVAFKVSFGLTFALAGFGSF
jgi:uncharacterized membrane protein (Fun14 family)